MNKLGKTFKGLLSVNQLIIGVLVALVLGIMIGLVSDLTIGINTTTSNVTGATYTLIAFVPLAIVLAVVISYFLFIGKK